MAADLPYGAGHVRAALPAVCPGGTPEDTRHHGASAGVRADCGVNGDCGADGAGAGREYGFEPGQSPRHCHACSICGGGLDTAFVCDDWGGVVGFCLTADSPARIASRLSATALGCHQEDTPP